MRDTIKKHSDFIMPENCPTARTPFFIAKAQKTKFPGDARYGLVATKKTFPLAVDRNRAKRLLRAWLVENSKMMNPDMDYVFIAKIGILKADKLTGVANMKNALDFLK
ncbi:MAG TPA: ribonuclease P protein component [Alphaproteobacteria bacterium]|nr:ribonuclease P protein component [Alphaproteobacteria bacterium]